MRYTKNKKRNKGKKRDIQQEVLEEMLSCSTCTDLGKVKTNTGDVTVMDIDEMIQYLPGVDYVLKRMLNYMFSNGLTTGDPDDDRDKLDPWLYETKNKEGSTNYEVLMAVIGEASVYGEGGLRFLDDSLYLYKKGYYAMLIEENEGIEAILGYIIRKDGKAIEKDIKTDEWDTFTTLYDIEHFFEENGLVLLDPSEFLNIRNDTTYLHGISPFTRDTERLNLLGSVYDHLNYDIEYDGPGRIILRPKDGLANGNNEVSTGQIVNNSMGAQEARNEKAKQEARRVAKEIKESSSDAVVLLSNAFSDNIEHLPRVTKSTEFMDWLSSDTLIIAQILGMSPTLLEIGKIHGNVSVEKIIDNAMLNTIIPMREKYAIQFSKMLSDHLGVRKIYFNKYDMEQVEDANTQRKKVAEMIRDLCSAHKNTPSEELNSLILEATEFLRTSFRDDYGTPLTL